MLDAMRDLVASRDLEGIRHYCQELHPAEISTAITALAPAERAIVFRLLDKDLAIAVFENLDTDEQQQLLESLRSEEVVHILENMSPDDRVRFLDEVPAKVAKKIMEMLSPAEREISALLLGYPPQTAGRIMTPDYITLHESMTVQEALERIRRTGLDKETIYTCYVTDDSRHLTGVVTLRELVLAAPEAKVAEIMSRRVISVQTTDDQEKAATLVKEYDFLALPVVDKEDRLVGIVTFDDAMDVLEDESSEDFQRIAAVALAPAHAPARYFGSALASRVGRRLPWLVLLVLAETVSGGIIGNYQHAISAAVVLTFFIPLLMSTTGNTGSQMVTLTVRSLATGEIPPGYFARTLLEEVFTGLALGLILGTIGFIMASLLGSGLTVQLVVAFTLLATVTTAQVLGVVLPFIFRWLRLDPAVASAPLIATLGDIITLLVYFNMARALLGV